VEVYVFLEKVLAEQAETAALVKEAEVDLAVKAVEILQAGVTMAAAVVPHGLALAVMAPMALLESSGQEILDSFHQHKLEIYNETLYTS
jgi:hypothetical protein